MGPARTAPPAWVERLETLATSVFGSRRVSFARRVFDRYNAAGGGLLAAGIAYNTLFALVPLAIFAGGLIGLLVRDPAMSNKVAGLLTSWAPPLAGVFGDVVDGLASASPSLSLIGLVGMIWGISRLFASLEVGIEAIFAGVARRGVVSRTIRRLASVLVVAAMIIVAIVATWAASVVGEAGLPESGVREPLLVGLFLLPVVLAAAVLMGIYRVVPPARPTLTALAVPAVAIGFGLVALTHVFAILAPRLFGANFVYGTLGAIFVGLAWLGLTYTFILLGAAWVRERMLSEAETAPVA